MSKKLPALTAKKLIRFLNQQGFVFDRQSGSHVTLKHPVQRRTVTVPIHTGTDIGKGLLKKILSDAGFSLDEFLKLR